MGSREHPDPHYGEQEGRQPYSSYVPTYPLYPRNAYSYTPVYRFPYSYVPAASTHGYGNINHATGTGYVYSREHPDIHYGEQLARQEYSSYGPVYYPGYAYSYAPVYGY